MARELGAHIGVSMRVRSATVRIACTLALVAGVATLAGCQSTDVVRLSHAQMNALVQVKVGMTREEIIRQLGNPERTETSGPTEYLYYHPELPIRETEAMGYSPVVIENGKVIGFGKDFEVAKRKGAAPKNKA
jgi:hypothetical protein